MIRHFCVSLDNFFGENMSHILHNTAAHRGREAQEADVGQHPQAAAQHRVFYERHRRQGGNREVAIIVIFGWHCLGDFYYFL